MNCPNCDYGGLNKDSKICDVCGIELDANIDILSSDTISLDKALKEMFKKSNSEKKSSSKIQIQTEVPKKDDGDDFDEDYSPDSSDELDELAPVYPASRKTTQTGSKEEKSSWRPLKSDETTNALPAVEPKEPVAPETTVTPEEPEEPEVSEEPEEPEMPEEPVEPVVSEEPEAPKEPKEPKETEEPVADPAPTAKIEPEPDLSEIKFTIEEDKAEKIDISNLSEIPVKIPRAGNLNGLKPKPAEPLEPADTINPEERDDESGDEPAQLQLTKKSKNILGTVLIGILFIILIAVIIFMIFTFSSWKKDEEEVPETTTPTATEPTTLNSKQVENTVQEFFKELELYFTEDDNTVLARFLNPVAAAKKMGEVQKLPTIQSLSVESIAMQGEDAYQVVTSVLNSDKGQRYIRDIVWTLKIEKDENKLVVKDFSNDFTMQADLLNRKIFDKDARGDQTTTQPEETSETSTAATTTTAPTTTKVQTTTEEILEGFVAAGVFRGGNDSVKSAKLLNRRIGNHAKYERLVFDFDNSGELVPKYKAELDATGTTIVVNIYGVTNLESQSAAPDWSNIKSVDVVSDTRDSVKITIKLGKRAEFKAFGLNSPARLIIDIAK